VKCRSAYSSQRVRPGRYHQPRHHPTVIGQPDSTGSGDLTAAHQAYIQAYNEYTQLVTTGGTGDIKPPGKIQIGLQKLHGSEAASGK